MERALELWGAPVYVRRQIVHNSHVVRDLEERGVVFVESEEDVPAGEIVILAAHGVAPDVHASARSRGLRVVDTTCPLVTKVHSEARAYAALGYAIVLIGHAGHDEVVGTIGEAPDSIVLVQTEAEAELLELPGPGPLAYLMQTTLSVDDAASIVDVLRRRFPGIEGPRRDDICYATANRQRAIKALLPEVDLVLVVGSASSSNSTRLVEVARAGGVPAHLIDDESAIDERWLEGVETVGLTSGASAPEHVVRAVCAWFAARGVEEIRPQRAFREGVTFRLPALEPQREPVTAP